jgi:hypothetical protein
MQGIENAEKLVDLVKRVRRLLPLEPGLLDGIGRMVRGAMESNPWIGDKHALKGALARRGCDS